MKLSTRIALAAVAAGLAFGAPAAPATPEALATKAGCATCHTADRKLIGPSYKEIAAKYKGRADAPALLAAKVRKGGQGVWGPVPMAPTDATKISDADLRTVIDAILKSK